ncbi:MAG: hypothetical protein AB7H90_00710 [Alphaproteobacteria bacterium]
MIPLYDARLLAQLFAATLPTDKTVVEVDRFSFGLGDEISRLWRDNRRVCRLLPEPYVASIEFLGLVLEPGAEYRADVVIGPHDSDIVTQPSPLQLWRGRPVTIRKQRSLDTLFAGDDRCALLVLGEDTAPDVLAGASRLVAAHQPVVAIRASTVSGLASTMEVLRQSADYEWLTELEFGPVYRAFPRARYGVAAPNSAVSRLQAPYDPALNGDIDLMLALDRMRAPTIDETARLVIPATEHIASEGLYQPETHAGLSWRWGGMIDHISVLFEPRGFGDCEAHLYFVHILPGAVDAITHLSVNGRPAAFTTVREEVTKIVFRAFSETPLLVRIACPAGTYVSGDPRRLNLALGQLELRYERV